MKGLDLIAYVVQAIFWTIGYYFGFTLVTILTFGFVVPEEYFQRPNRVGNQMLFKKHEKLHLGTEPVSMIGWIFIIMLVTLINVVF